MKNCEFMFHIITCIFDYFCGVHKNVFCYVFCPLMLIISVIFNYKFCKDMNYVKIVNHSNHSSLFTYNLALKFSISNKGNN